MEEFPTNEHEDLENFRSHIAELKKTEEEKGLVNNLADCNPTELEENEKVLYKKLKSNDLTIDEFNKHRKIVKESGNENRINFVAYIANKLIVR